MIRDMIGFFFLFWVPFIVTIFLVALFSLFAITGKFDKKEPVIDVSEHVDLVEEYYADDDREIVYIRRNQVPNNNEPHHFSISFLDAKTEYVQLFLDGEEIKVKKLELEEKEDD